MEDTNGRVRRLRSRTTPSGSRTWSAAGRSLQPSCSTPPSRGRGAEPDGQRHRAPALRLRSKGDRRRSAGRSVPRRSVPPEGPDGLAGWGPDDARLALLRRHAPRRRRQRARGPTQARRPGHLRTHQHVRARTLADLRAPASTARRRTRGTRPASRADRAAAPRRPRARASCRWLTRATASGPSGRPRPAAVWWDSSRHARGTRWRRTPARGWAASRPSTP